MSIGRPIKSKIPGYLKVTREEYNSMPPGKKKEVTKARLLSGLNSFNENPTRPLKKYKDEEGVRIITRTLLPVENEKVSETPTTLHVDEGKINGITISNCTVNIMISPTK